MNHQPYTKFFMACLWLGIITGVSSCKKFLDMKAPKTEIITPVVFASNSTANAAMLSIYARMATVNGAPSRNIPWLSGLSSDEFTNYSTVQNVLDFYTNSLNPTNTNLTGYLWTPYYNIIYQCNAVIEGLQNSENISAKVKTQLTAEAKFTRAYIHFLLTNFFGDIPVITTTDYRINAVLPRSSVQMVYQQIQMDLLDAKQNLQAVYVGADGETPSNERVRPNKAAAEALLARLYLFKKEYTNAESEATEVIKQSTYGLPTDLSGVFLKNSIEAIWQLQPVPNIPTTEADMFVLSGAPTAGLNRSVALSDQLMALWEMGDGRKDKWCGSVTAAGKTYAFVNKHKYVGAANTTEYSMILRLGEQYLIRAEARAQQQNVKDAIDDVNALRSRANVSVYDYLTISDPLPLIADERQRELFAEGHRWFDLKRTGKVDEVMTTATATKGGTWKSRSALYPIPQTERDNNPNLSQNDY